MRYIVAWIAGSITLLFSFAKELGMVHQDRFVVETGGHREMHDITGRIGEIVAASRIRVGVVQIFNVGSTGAVGTIEFEPGLQGDLPEMLDKLMPPSRHYGHEQAWHDGNGHSHLQATLLGPSISVPVADGRLVLGTWQQVFHLECDIKPRRREIVVTVIGE
jgi:secondary thiamine-phosphate synthase enzyme